MRRFLPLLILLIISFAFLEVAAGANDTNINNSTSIGNVSKVIDSSKTALGQNIFEMLDERGDNPELKAFLDFFRVDTHVNRTDLANYSFGDFWDTVQGIKNEPLSGLEVGKRVIVGVFTFFPYFAFADPLVQDFKNSHEPMDPPSWIVGLSMVFALASPILLVFAVYLFFAGFSPRVGVIMAIIGLAAYILLVGSPTYKYERFSEGITVWYQMYQEGVELKIWAIIAVVTFVSLFIVYKIIKILARALLYFAGSFFIKLHEYKDDISGYAASYMFLIWVYVFVVNPGYSPLIFVIFGLIIAWEKILENKLKFRKQSRNLARQEKKEYEKYQKKHQSTGLDNASISGGGDGFDRQ